MLSAAYLRHLTLNWRRAVRNRRRHLALLLAALLAALLRLLALRLGVVERRRRAAVPLLGGVAVVAVAAFVAGRRLDGRGAAGTRSQALRRTRMGSASSDSSADLSPDRPLYQLRFQAAVVTGAAALTVDPGGLGPVVGVVAVGWITLATHAFTSLDHADGVMGTVAVVAGLALSGCAAAEVMDGLAALLSVLAAALTGFLMHNWPPARIVPGRCGALFRRVRADLGGGTGPAPGGRPGGRRGRRVRADGRGDHRRRTGAGVGGGPGVRCCAAPDHLVHRLRRLVRAQPRSSWGSPGFRRVR